MVASEMLPLQQMGKWEFGKYQPNYWASPTTYLYRDDSLSTEARRQKLSFPDLSISILSFSQEVFTELTLYQALYSILEILR